MRDIAHPRAILPRMTETERQLVMARFRLAVELHEAGVAMMRQNLRRRYPSDSEQEIDARLEAWLMERPGAEHGDCDGKPVAWPLRRSD